MYAKPLPSCPHAYNRVLKFVLLLVLALGMEACSLLKGALELPEEGIRSLLSLNQKNAAPDPVELQSQVLRFSDSYIDKLDFAADKLQHDGEPAQQRNILIRHIGTTHEVLAIASGSNAYANLLDMVVLVSLNRMNIEDYWMPKYYGESARTLLTVSQESEREIWRIAATALKPGHIKELRTAIQAWHNQYPDGRSPRDVGSLGFSATVAKMNRSPQPEGSSVFDLLDIDPLADIDPAIRELANTRLFAERGMFLARHMPTLVRWESRLLAIQTAEMPQMEQLLANTTQLSASADRVSQTAERLPDFISTERQQIVQALDKQRPGLISLAAQTEKTLDAGKQMSDASTATIKSVQDVLRQIDSRPPNPNAEPFRINDYTAAVVQVNATVQDLEKLLQAFDQTLSPANFDGLSTRLDALTRQAQAGSKEVVDYTFQKILILGLILIGSACGMGLASAVVFLRLKRKFA